MNLPPLLLGAGLAFWGWQSANLLVGIALGIALEALRLARPRLDLGATEHSTIADLSTIGFVLLAALISANRGVAHGILQAFVWLPAAVSPILLAQYASAEGRVPLSALLRYVRKLKRERPDTPDPLVDVSAPYFALTLLAAGMANARGPEYYVGVVAGAACLLYAARRRHANLVAATAMLAAATGLGYVGHLGLAQAHLMLIDWVMDLDLVRTADPDPYRVRTEIGTLGRLKKYDAIVLRVYATPESGERLRLLHRNSYNTYLGTTWIAREAPMAPQESEADNETWILSPLPPVDAVRMAARFDLGRTTLALPAGTTRLGGFPATSMQRNAMGSVHAFLAVQWAPFEALLNPASSLAASPMPEDLALPPGERAVLAAVAEELGLAQVPAAEAARRLERHFQSFRYSLYRDRSVPRGETAIGDFLRRTQAGHCEYFAAATTLLLRAAGIPSRYATGYAMVEYSRLEGAFVVRSRHAHAWAQAWIGGRWVDVDTTPAAWLPEEEAQAPVWQGLADLARYLGFRWSQRGEFKAGDGWYALLAVLAVVLAWRVLRGRKVVRDALSPPREAPARPGADSEFMAIARRLPPREAWETRPAWLERIADRVPAPVREPLHTALALHQRLRFDPAGLSPEDRARLRRACAEAEAGLVPRP